MQPAPLSDEEAGMSRKDKEGRTHLQTLKER